LPLDAKPPTTPLPPGVSAAPAAKPLDAAADVDQSPNHAGTKLRVRGERPTLLVVDDEPEVLSSIHDLLRLEYPVITRGRGAGALDWLRSSETIHAVLSDQRMPGMSGVELLREAKTIRPETTRLLFTAHADIYAVIDAINQGHVFRYLVKPWDPDELR